MGPTKSTPTTSKVVDSCVLSLGSRPDGGAANAIAWNRLHPQHDLMVRLASRRRRGIQYFPRTFASVSPTPPAGFGGPSGGVLAYVDTTIPIDRLFNLEVDGKEVMWLLLKPRRTPRPL